MAPSLSKICCVQVVPGLICQGRLIVLFGPVSGDHAIRSLSIFNFNDFISGSILALGGAGITPVVIP